MGEGFFNKARPIESAGFDAAVLLHLWPDGGTHAGVWYRKNKSEEILHLGRPDQLCFGGWPGELYWASPEVHRTKLFSVGVVCRRIHARFKKDNKMPYGIAFCGSSFDKDGTLRLGAGARGLTCATFVLAVFNAVGETLIDESSWPLRTDEDLQFLARIDGVFAPENVATLRAEVESGAKRIRPEEVFAACAVSPAAKYEDIKPRAVAAIEALKQRTAPAPPPPSTPASSPPSQ